MAKFLLLLSLLFLATALPAQPPAPAPAPAPSQPTPPFLDEPHHWQIHDEDGEMPLEITAEYRGKVGAAEVYDLTITGKDADGDPYSCWAVAFDYSYGMAIEVYNGDSGLWTTWVWQGDHYEKVGGTASVRTYHPVY